MTGLGRCVVTIASFTSLLYMAGCHANRGILIKTKLPLGFYLHSAMASNGRDSRVIEFPTVQVYDASGNLTFESHGLEDNASLLEHFASRESGLHPIPKTVSLTAAIDGLSGLHDQQHAIFRTKRPTVVVIFLEGCDACSVLGETLVRHQAELLDKGENLILLTVTHSS